MAPGNVYAAPERTERRTDLKVNDTGLSVQGVLVQDGKCFFNSQRPLLMRDEEAVRHGMRLASHGDYLGLMILGRNR